MKLERLRHIAAVGALAAGSFFPATPASSEAAAPQKSPVLQPQTSNPESERPEWVEIIKWLSGIGLPLYAIGSLGMAYGQNKRQMESADGTTYKKVAEGSFYLRAAGTTAFIAASEVFINKV